MTPTVSQPRAGHDGRIAKPAVRAERTSRITAAFVARRRSGPHSRPYALLLLLSLFTSFVFGEERFPAPDFTNGHTLPATVTAPPKAAVWAFIDVTALALALSLAAYLVLRKRSRRGVFALGLASLAYFGFYRQGCVCPVGSIQNVAYAAGGHGYALPWLVAAFFVLPLLFALFFGRVFCSSVCPLGAVQDVVLFKPLKVPGWLEESLSLFAWFYLGAAVMLATLGSDFVVCRYDPFVSLFRLSGPAHILFYGGLLLAIGTVVGRPYCRFLCPYGVVLRVLSRFAKHSVSITPSQCIDCRLCEQSCPFGAIRYPAPRANARQKKARRREVASAALALPALLVAFAFVGYFSAPALAQRDFTIKLSQRIYQEDSGLVSDTTEESRAFRSTSATTEQLHESARQIRRKFAIGATLLGLWVGGVIGSKLLAVALRRSRDGYTADPGGCVSCARCYSSCPIELERRETLRPLHVHAPSPVGEREAKDENELVGV